MPARVFTIACLLAACTPTFDWREVRIEGDAVGALFPCKPVGRKRSVELATARVELALHACTAGEAVFAIALADVAEPAQVAPALSALREAAARNLSAAAGTARALNVPGSTPNVQAGRYAIVGRRPDGSAVQEELAVFARGTRVYQASVLGAQLDADAVQTFVESIRFAR